MKQPIDGLYVVLDIMLECFYVLVPWAVHRRAGTAHQRTD